MRIVLNVLELVKIYGLNYPVLKKKRYYLSLSCLVLGTRLFCTSTVVEECEIVELLQQIDTKTKKPLKKKVLFVKNGAVVVYHVQVNNSICIEKFSDFPQLGRFTLCTEGKTVAVGKVTGL
ncbi:hypothetical protein GYH30_043924 [Glycine max]|nr:hypothetical protein GYH30_043924 [Glycine max]KAH1149630.1 hypothetical protein GYH30_043924 [Glycine max]